MLPGKFTLLNTFFALLKVYMYTLILACTPQMLQAALNKEVYQKAASTRSFGSLLSFANLLCLNATFHMKS